MLSTELQSFQPGELTRHPWQDNVPDLQAPLWDEFLADVRQRGIVEPIRVSTRLGYPVIVDGHQRHRAAVELGLESIQAFVQPFADEAQEVEFLAHAARLRRHLTDAQRVTLARAYEAYFKPMAAEKQRIGKAEETLGPIGPKVEKPDARKSSAQAAKAAGLSDSTYKRGKAIQDKAPAPVVAAWEREEISTNAAHTLTKAPDPITEALNREEIDVYQALRVEKDKSLRADVLEGRKTVQEAVSLADMLQKQIDDRAAAYGTKEADKMQKLLQQIMDIGVEEYAEVAQCRQNTEVWGGSFSSDWAEAIRHMRAVAQAYEGRQIQTRERVIDMEVE